MRSLTVCLSHDIDRLRKSYQYITHDLRRGRVRKAAGILVRRPQREDPYWCLEKMAALEESLGVRSTCFFLQESIRPTPDPRSWKLAFGRYRFDEPDVAEAIRWLADNGWEIGLHGSYNSYRSLELLQQEKQALEQVLGREVIGIRQHYLNLDVPQTWQLQREAGFLYDASFGLKPTVGFRDGRYRPFVDPSSGMTVIPLALMECYLFRAGQGDRKRIWSIVLDLIAEAERTDALLVVLWHQRMYNAADFPGYGEVYEQFVRECQARGARFLTCEEAFLEARNAVAVE